MFYKPLINTELNYYSVNKWGIGFPLPYNNTQIKDYLCYVYAHLRPGVF